MNFRWPIAPPLDSNFLYERCVGWSHVARWDIWKRGTFLPFFLVSASGLPKPHPDCIYRAMKNRNFLSRESLQILGLRSVGCVRPVTGRMGTVQTGWARREQDPQPGHLAADCWCLLVRLAMEPSACPPVERPRKEGGFLSFCCRGPCSTADKSQVK